MVEIRRDTLEEPMIATEFDSFIDDKDKTYWKAKLSDGTVVYEDDDRPEYAQKSAWLRLKEYCTINNLFVQDMWIVFRSHTEYCGHSDIGFFFTKGALGSPATRTEYRYICGPIIEDRIHTKVWRVPEVIEVESEIRPIEGNEEKIICLPINP